MFNLTKHKRKFILSVIIIGALIIASYLFFSHNFSGVYFCFRIAILSLGDLCKWVYYNAGFINAFAMIILVIMTFYYAVETHKLAIQAKKQADNALISELYNEHRELVNGLYNSLLEDWIEPLYNFIIQFKENQDNLEILTLIDNFTFNKWESYRLKLSHYVYRINGEYLNKIEAIDGHFKIYEKNKIAVSNQLYSTINNLFSPYFSSLNEQFKTQMMKIDNQPDFKLSHNSLISSNNIDNAFFSKENLEQIKYFLQNNLSEDIKIDYINENKPDTVIKTIKSEDLLKIIKKSEDFIKENNDLKSLGELLKKLKNNVIELKKDIESELSKKRKDIAKEIKAV